MTPRSTLEILADLHAAELHLADKSALHHHDAGMVQHTRKARALAEAIKALQLQQAQATAGQFDPLPCGDRQAQARQFVEDLRRVVSPDAALSAKTQSDPAQEPQVCTPPL